MDHWFESSLAIGQIVWVDLLLSGDNAVVIALACRSLPPEQRKWGIILGAGAAVALRIAFAFAISQLLQVPFLKVVGGFLLVWIAIKLARGESAEERKIDASDRLLIAIWTIALADAAMSLDNVIAIAAIAQDNYWLFIFGLALSIPLIVVGSTLIMKMIERFPIIVWGGAALLGWIAGEMIATDPVVAPQIGLPVSHVAQYALAAAGAALVVAIGYLLRQRARAREGYSPNADG